MKATIEMEYFSFLNFLKILNKVRPKSRYDTINIIVWNYFHTNKYRLLEKLEKSRLKNKNIKLNLDYGIISAIHSYLLSLNDNSLDLKNILAVFDQKVVNMFNGINLNPEINI